MQEFNLTEDQARYRLEKILPLFEQLGHSPRRGLSNKIWISEESLELFRRAIQLERERTGNTWQKALETLKSELQPYSLGELRRHYERQIEVLKKQIQILEQQLDFLRRQNEDLREMLKRLMDKAAPGLAAAEPAKEKPPTA